jgi:hypothetical protein
MPGDTRENRTVLCQIEAQGLSLIGCVDDHKYWALSRVARPVSRCGVHMSAVYYYTNSVLLTRILKGVASVFGLIIDIRSEGRNCLSLI